MAVLILSALLRAWIEMGGADDGGVEGLDVKKLVNHPGKRSVLMTVVFVNAITQTYICGLTTGVAYLFSSRRPSSCGCSRADPQPRPTFGTGDLRRPSPQ